MLNTNKISGTIYWTMKIYASNLVLDVIVVDDHFGKPNRKKRPSNIGRKELVSG